MSQKRLSCRERRKQIIQVATDLFASRGFKGATTRAIASAANVSEAIIFRHFATKEDLYDAIITTSIEARQAMWEKETPAIDDTENLDRLLSSFAHSFLRRNRKDQTFVRLMLYSALEDHKFRQRFFESYRSPTIRFLRERIAKGVKSGEFATVDPNQTMLSFFFSLLQYAVSRFVASSEVPSEEADAAYIENLVNVYVGCLRGTKPQWHSLTA